MKKQRVKSIAKELMKERNNKVWAFTKLCFRAPTIASSLASKDIIGLARDGSADSI